LRTLIVHAHPVTGSFSHALLETVCAALKSRGHTLRVIDLYAERFDPVLSRDERERYLTDAKGLEALVQPHVDALRWCEHLVFVYPVWFYGMPAIMKGWLERVWLPGVAFLPPPVKGKAAVPGLQHIGRLSVVCTGGAPWWWLKIIGDPNQRLVMRGLRALMHPRCQKTWLQLHNMNNVSRAECEAFVAKVRRTFEGMS
jgi:putative NADPH-quinone reductase